MNELDEIVDKIAYNIDTKIIHILFDSPIKPDNNVELLKELYKKEYYKIDICKFVYVKQKRIRGLFYGVISFDNVTDVILKLKFEDNGNRPIINKQINITGLTLNNYKLYRLNRGVLKL